MKPYYNLDTGEIEYLGGTQAQHRPECRPATEFEVSQSTAQRKQALEVTRAEAKPAPSVTIPDIIAKAKHASSLEELQAVAEEFKDRMEPSVQRVIDRKRQELESEPTLVGSPDITPTPSGTKVDTPKAKKGAAKKAKP